jgi:GNAT superfamily N-acetyltransferase
LSGARPEITRLSKRHDRAGFTCGVEALDRYLRRQASQDMKQDVATVFVATAPERDRVLGYYTLSMASLHLDQLPADLARRMPRYPTLPAVRLGRLAVHEDERGRGLGTHLLMDAMARALKTEIAWTALLVDAKDEGARRFYAPFGFQRFEDEGLRLYLMRGTIAPLFE